MNLVKSNPQNFGLVTTPQLHFLVQSTGELNTNDIDPAEVDKESYADFFSQSFVVFHNSFVDNAECPTLLYILKIHMELFHT